MWSYSQTTGKMLRDGADFATGYSGIGEGLNNPNMQQTPNIGPIPRGLWTIGPSYKHPELGSLCMNLYPHTQTETFGRTVFRIHADSIENYGKKVASHGCLIFNKPERQKISDSQDRTLEITI